MQVSPIWKWTISMAFWKPCRKVYVVSKMGGHPKCQGIIATFHSSKDTLWIYDAVLLWKSLHFFSRKDSIYLNNPWINRFRKWWYTIYRPKCISPCVASHCTDRPETKPLRTIATNPTTDPPKVQIHLDQVPFYDGAVDCIKMGIESSLQADLDAEVVEPTGRGRLLVNQWIFLEFQYVYIVQMYMICIYIYFNVTPCWVSWLSKSWDKSLWCFSYDLL